SKSASAARAEHFRDGFLVAIEPGEDAAGGAARLVTAPTRTALVSAATGEDLEIDRLRVFSCGVGVLLERANGARRPGRLGPETATRTASPLPDELCELTLTDPSGLLPLDDGYEARTFRYALETLASPRRVFEVDLASGAQRQISGPPGTGGTARYES